MKEPAECLTLRSTVVDYGDTPVLSADKIHVVLPNENVDLDFHVLSVEYYVDGKMQALELTLKLHHLYSVCSRLSVIFLFELISTSNTCSFMRRWRASRLK